MDELVPTVGWIDVGHVRVVRSFACPQAYSGRTAQRYRTVVLLEQSAFIDKVLL